MTNIIEALQTVLGEQADEWRTTHPERILCEIYTKLIAAIIQHWLFLRGNVHHLGGSLTLVRQVVRQYS